MKNVARKGAYAAGGVGALGLAACGVLVAEAKFAHSTISKVKLQSPPNASGLFGAPGPEGAAGAEPPLEVAMMGDSSAAGYGMDRAEDTPGAALAHGIAERTGRQVHLHDLSVVGALSSDLDAQVTQALEAGAQVAVILIGANDVTHLVRPSRSVRFLEHAVKRLEAGGVAVVVGTCPDLGTIKPILPPLRSVARWWSRRIALEQTVYVVRAGGRTVSLASILGPEFAAHPDFLFGPDRFHPSEVGYVAAANVLIPSTLAALGLIGDEDANVETYRGDPVLPLAGAVFRAVSVPGTEVGPGARPKRRLGRLWATVAHRRAGVPAAATRGSLVE